MDIANCFRNTCSLRKPWDLPVEWILCIAAILGSISILLASTKIQPSSADASLANRNQILVIIPVKEQQNVKLALPRTQSQK